jgi:hypothetical protein
MTTTANLPIPKIISLFILISILASCSYIPGDLRKSLKLAGENKSQLIEVLEHYKKTDKNKEKLEAAKYLIRNMPGHYSISGQEIFTPVFDQLGPNIRLSGGSDEYAKLFSRLIDSIQSNGNGNFEFEDDLRNISSSYLIENIDLAFLAYNRIPENLRQDRDKFYRYILPYRNYNEPLEPGLRKYFYEKFDWVYERMEQYGSIEKVACDLFDSIYPKWNLAFKYPFEYPFTMPVSHNYKIGVSNTCTSMITMAVFIFRSLGIAVANDLIPIWGNNLNNNGHEWFVLFSADTTIAIDIPMTEIMNRLYTYEAMPKIYRRSYKLEKSNLFSFHCIDVTKKYRSTSNYIVPFSFSNKIVRLAVFNRRKGWVTVDVSQGSGFHKFRNLGRGIVYGVVVGEKFNKHDVDALFYLDDAGEINLKADKEATINAILTRKHPFFTLRQAYRGERLESLNGAEFQGANKRDFSDAECLLKINNHYTTNNISYKLDNSKQFTCYRIINPEKPQMHLAGFNLVKNDRIVNTEWEVFFGGGEIHPEGKNVIDDDPLTNISADSLSINYYFPEPVAINEFSVQIRTDDNEVKPGNKFELMYWDSIWVSAGEKIATDTLLVYENIPSGTLYWLKNRTKGTQDHVFLLDEKGYQYWPGVTSVNYMYRDFLNLERLCEE